ncbi:MAG: hypothetical protein ABSD29_19365, partial [Verrucomicrobiota bacterium]
LVVVVEACTDLANPAWSPVGTNTLTGGSSYFSDPQWTNYPARFYRLWGLTFAGVPAVLWNPQAQTGDGSFGVRTNRFGFNITGTSNLVVVVEACTDLANPAWSPVGTNTLTGGSSYFSDPQWTNYPARWARTPSPAARLISAIPSGRIIPPGSTASAPRDGRARCPQRAGGGGQSPRVSDFLLTALTDQPA